VAHRRVGQSQGGPHLGLPRRRAQPRRAHRARAGTGATSAGTRERERERKRFIYIDR